MYELRIYFSINAQANTATCYQGLGSLNSLSKHFVFNLFGFDRKFGLSTPSFALCSTELLQQQLCPEGQAKLVFSVHGP